MMSDLEPATKAFLAVLRTAAGLTAGLAAELAQHQLKPAHYNVLRILRGAGPEGLSCADIAARLLTPGPDVTRLLDRLERHGLTERDRSTTDRRRVVARLSPAGQRLVESLDGPIRALHRRQFAALDAPTLTRLVATLAAVHVPHHHSKDTTP